MAPSSNATTATDTSVMSVRNRSITMMREDDGHYNLLFASTGSGGCLTAPFRNCAGGGGSSDFATATTTSGGRDRKRLKKSPL